MLTTTSREPLRILYVTETVPGRAGFGGELRCLHIARALAEVGRVEVAHLRKPGEDHSAAERDAEFPLVSALEVRPRPNHGLAGLLRWTFDPRSNYPFGLGVDAEAASRLRAMLGNYDLVWFFRLRAPDMFPNADWPRSVVDIDDLPTTYQVAAIEKADGFRQRWMERRRMFAWRRRERLLGERFTALSVCSEDDRRSLEEIGVRSPVHVIPNGFEVPEREPEYRPASPPRFGFIGLLDYFPNRDAIDWFVRECWPLIRRRIPEARLRVAGQDREGFLRSSDPSIDVLGWIADTDEEMKTWSAMVVPVRVGAGTRIKIAHAFSRKCPVVSTTHGAYGYGATSGRELLLADTAEEFAAACVRMASEPAEAAGMAERAWKVFEEKWSWDAIRPRVHAAVESCLQGSAVQNIL
jgi:glycosyltransferase involved in cell wall biosynthesis